MRARRVRDYKGSHFDVVSGVQFAGRPSPPYLLRDEFLTAAVAPLASPRTCQPGPGTLTLSQTDGQLSISSGRLQFPAGLNWGGCSLIGAGLARRAGRALLATINWSDLNHSMLAWANANSTNFNGYANVAQANYSLLGNLMLVVESAASPVLSAGTAGVDYQFIHVLRSTGGFLLANGGTEFPGWKLAWVFVGDSTATVYPAFSNQTGVGAIDHFRVVDLPAPWSSDYGIATSRNAGSVAAPTSFTHTANALIEFTLTTLPASDVAVVIFRLKDGNNRWQVNLTAAGDFQLYEIAAGVATLRGLGAGVLASGDRVVIVIDGSTIIGLSGNTQRFVYGSATNFATETAGLFAQAGVGGAVSDLIAWPRDVGSYLPVGV